VTFPRCCSHQSSFKPAQAMVEFALVASLFLLLMFAVLQLSLAVLTYNSVAFAAREAARYAIVHGPSGPNPATNTQIQQVAINAAPALSLSASNINVNWVTDPNLPTKQDIQVKVTYPYQIQIPFVSAVTANFASTSQLLVAQ
jgi:Flp pilus assembly protein TadG